MPSNTRTRIESKKLFMQAHLCFCFVKGYLKTLITVKRYSIHVAIAHVLHTHICIYTHIDIWQG